jgi:beta-glucosidase
VALDLNVVEPATTAADDVAAADRHHEFRQRWFLDPLFGRGYPSSAYEAYARGGQLKGIEAHPPFQPLDFLGVNYYTRETVAAGLELPHRTRFVLRPGVARTTMDWEVHPAGLTRVLVGLHRQYAPPAMFVTENGAAFAEQADTDGRVDDEPRRRFLESHIRAAADAIDAGVPLQGFFVWSLIDNFEWDKGFGQRFGIVHVDYATQRRRVKASGRWYQGLLTSHARIHREP